MMENYHCFLCMTQDSDIACPHGCGTLACCQRHLKIHLGGASNGSVATSHCRPFKIENSSTFGRHLVATRDIAPLEEILNENVAVLGPATKSAPVCLECLKPAQQENEIIFRCSGCQFPMCKTHQNSLLANRHHDSRECQMLHESKMGPSIVDLKSDSLVHACIFLSRMWSLKSKDSELLNDLYFLMDGDTTDIEETKSFLSDLSDILQHNFKLTDFSSMDILRCMGIKRTNANTLDSINVEGGVALYATYPLMNNHCNCNTSCVVDEKTFDIRVVAQRNIKKGEQITTRYLGPWEGQPKRIYNIYKHWQFICQCSRCLDKTDLNTYFSAIRCQSEQCHAQNPEIENLEISSVGSMSSLSSGSETENSGFILPIKAQMLGTPWQCNSCSSRKGHRQIIEYLESVESRISSSIQRNGYELESLEALVSSLCSDLHPNHFLIFNLKKKAVAATRIGNVTKTCDMKILLKFVRQVLSLVEVLDPGVTLQRATLLKTLASVRIQLAKRLLAERGESFQTEYDKQMMMAVVEFKKASICIGG